MKRVIPLMLLALGLVICWQGPGPVRADDPQPDLIVRSDILARHWVVREEDLPASFCSVIEGEVTPGVHLLLRFTVTTPNIGGADIALGDPNDHIAAGDGLYELAACHNHFHFRHYALYQLIDPATGNAWRAAKRGFCMIDTDPNPGYYGRSGPRRFASCGAVGIPGNQGISAGWSDTYNLHLGGQYFVLDGGDGQAPIPPGNYILRITVNPPFVAAAGESCPFVDPLGFCHQLPESDYSNNVGQIEVTIPDRVGKTGVGPGAGLPPTASERAEH